MLLGSFRVDVGVERFSHLIMCLRTSKQCCAAIFRVRSVTILV